MLALLLTATSLSAAAPTLENPEEIQVTGFRSSIPLSQTTANITVITAEDIEKGQYQSVADILKSATGLSIARAGSVGGQSQLRLRGAEANQVLVVLDGVKITDPAIGDEVQWELLDSLNIERIEIIRTPLSSIWGSDALAGVINIVTKDGKKNASSIKAEYGSFNTRTLSGNLAVSGDDWYVSSGLNYTKSGGSNVARTGSEKDGFKNITFTLKGGIDINAATQISASLHHSDSRNDYDTPDWSTGLPADSDHQSQSKKTYVAATANHQFSDMVSISTRLTWLETFIENSAYGADNGATGADKLGLYLDAGFKLSDTQNLTLALDHENTDFMQTGVASPWGDPNQKQSMKATGLAAIYSIQATDALTVDASLRRDWNDNFDDFTSWRVGTTLAITGTTRLYASASRGQKAPTFIERYGYFADQFVGNSDLSPEQSFSVELGIAAELTDNFTADIAVFSSKLKNEIDGFVYDPASYLFTAANKASDSKRSGFEISATWSPLETIALRSSYSYVDAVEFDAVGTKSTELRRPKHDASLAIEWQASDKATVSLVTRYTGKSKDLFFPPWPLPSERVTLKDYFLMRLAANVKVTDKISIYGRIENALNEKYEDIVGFSTPARSAYAGVKVSF